MKSSRFKLWMILGGVVLGGAWAGLIPIEPAGAGEPINIGDKKQLFIDQRFIESQENVKLTTNPADKLGPLFLSETTPFMHHPLMVTNVFEDDGKFKMYYSCITPMGRSLAYAESVDGVHWTRPPLGLVDINGNTNNNIIFGDQGETCPDIASVFKDEHTTSSERRYILFLVTWHGKANTEENGLYAYKSADGFHFTKVERVLPLVTDNPVNVNWDARVGKYVIFMRAFKFARDAENQRQIARIVTDDPLKPWPYNTSAPPHNIPSIDHIPVVLKTDEEVDPYSDIYYNNGMIYPWAQDVYLMFLTPFRHFGRERQPFFKFENFEKGGDFGFLESQLATSRDGIHWNRYDQWPYFPMGMADEWDRYYCVIGRNMVRKGNYLYQFYTSTGRTHDSGLYYREEHDKRIELKNGFGILRQRLDGFVSADVDNNGGWLQTPPLVFSGKHMRLNIDTGGMGTAFVEIRDAEGQPIPGFTLAESEETGGNYIDQKVYWKGSDNVSSLAGKPVRLYFKLKRAKLYAFQFTNE